MNAPSRTDRQRALAADEFVWDAAATPESHDYLVAPLLRHLDRAGARRVLDLGCGNGALTARLAAGGYRVIGLDASRSGIETARAAHPQLAFEVHALGQPLPEALRGAHDAVIAMEVIEHLLLPRQLFAAARAALRPGGLCIVSTPYHGYLKNLALALTGRFDAHWHPLRDYGHVKFFSRATLGELFLEQGFTVETFERVGRVPALAKSMILTGRTT